MKNIILKAGRCDWPFCGYQLVQGSDFHAQRYSQIWQTFEKLNTLHLKFHGKKLLKLASRKAQIIGVVTYKLLHVRHTSFTSSVSEKSSVQTLFLSKAIKKLRTSRNQNISLTDLWSLNIPWDLTCRRNYSVKRKHVQFFPLF